MQLVLQAAALADPGEVLILDMGHEVRIDDVARRLIERSGRHTDIVYTGPRTGEKLHEELLGDAEPDLRPNHPLITQACVPPLSPTFVLHAEGAQGTETMRGLAMRAIPPGSLDLVPDFDVTDAPSLQAAGD